MMMLGKYTLDPAIFLAPMAGITNSPFRLLARKLGCQAVVTEMVSAEGIARSQRGSNHLLFFEPAEHPILVQLFGHDPKVVAAAAVRCADMGFDGIDINMGCPVRKVVGHGSGCALMRDPQKAAAIVSAVQAALQQAGFGNLFLSAKIRAGWSAEETNAVLVSKCLADAGAQAITIHPRTRHQFYSGLSNWELITQVVQTVKIPVIGNGDIKSPADASNMRQQTACAGIMVGRAALGNPWLFGAIKGDLSESDYPPDAQERWQGFSFHLEKMIQWLGNEKRAVLQMRKHLVWYTRGLKGAAELRRNLALMNTAKDLYQAWHEILFGGETSPHASEKQPERTEDDSR